MSRRPSSALRKSSKSKHTEAPKKAKASAHPAATKKSGKWVYTYGDGRAEGKTQMRNLLGGKGAGLAEMASLGLPVPPGITITTTPTRYTPFRQMQIARFGGATWVPEGPLISVNEP